MYNASKEIPLDEKKVSKKERGHLIMKKLVTLVIAIALVLSLGTLAAAEGPVKAYAVTVMSGGAAWGRFEDGFMEACEELGWEGHYLAPSTANDYTAMVQLTETALNDGADGRSRRSGGIHVRSGRNGRCPAGREYGRYAGEIDGR